MGDIYVLFVKGQGGGWWVGTLDSPLLFNHSFLGADGFVGELLSLNFLLLNVVS